MPTKQTTVSEHLASSYFMSSSTGSGKKGSGLRIIVTNPFVWPYIRRGSERLLNDLAEYLAAQGHRVTVMAMAPEESDEKRNGVRYRLLRYGPDSRFRQLNRCHYFAFYLQPLFSEIEADVVYCLNYFDAFAAIKAKRKYGLTYKVIFQAVGIPTRKYFRAVPLDRWFINTVLGEADKVVALSNFAYQRLSHEFSCYSVVLHPPVFTESYSAQLHNSINENNDTPLILFVGDVCEPRKGAALLCMAFIVIKKTLPDARLVFTGNVSESALKALLSIPGIEGLQDSIEFYGVGDVNDLPALYQSATVTVLPAVWEAFGMVLVESLAAGTPVVGVRHGGITDIIEEGNVGYLFDPGHFSVASENVSGLVDSIFKTIALTSDENLSGRCRVHAMKFGWEKLGPEYEQMIIDIATAK